MYTNLCVQRARHLGDHTLHVELPKLTSIVNCYYSNFVSFTQAATCEFISHFIRKWGFEIMCVVWLQWSRIFCCPTIGEKWQLKYGVKYGFGGSDRVSVASIHISTCELSDFASSFIMGNNFEVVTYIFLVHVCRRKKSNVHVCVLG